MRVGIAADHGGFEMKEQLAEKLAAEGHAVVDFGNTVLDPDDDYPDFAIPLAQWRAGMWSGPSCSAAAAWVRRSRPIK